MLKSCATALLCLLPILAFGQQDNLPRWAPPFEVLKGSVQDPVLKVGSFNKDGKDYTQPSLWIGNKRVGFREINGTFRADQDEWASIIVDNHEVLRFAFFGNVPGHDSGYPFQTQEGTQPELKTDETTRTITYSKQYLLPNGESSIFSYTLKGLKDSKVEVSWDLGISQEKLDTFGQDFHGPAFWIQLATRANGASIGNNYRNSPILINQQPFKPTDEAVLTDKETAVMTGDGVNFQFMPDKPLEGFSLQLSDNYHFNLTEYRHGEWDGADLHASPTQRRAHDSLTLDFGPAQVKAADAPPAVGGVDFWARDVTDVPGPSTRNLMYNPSFEQGLRYWRWWQGGGHYIASDIPNYSMSSDAKFGHQSLLIQNTQGGQAIVSMPIPVQKGHTYTASFYGKALKAGDFVSVGIEAALSGSQMNWQKAQAMTHPLTADWTRTSFTFTPDTLAVSFVIASNATVLIDGLQLEEGSQSTDFVAPAIEGDLLTSDPDNFIAMGAPVGASFKLVGAAGLSGNVEFTLYNYYRETVYHKEAPFSLDKDGLATIALPFDPKVLGTGIFVLKANYTLTDGTALRDYFRLSVMDFLENKHATKDLFGNLSDAQNTTRGDDGLRDFMRWGWGSTTYGWGDQWQADLYKKYRVSNQMLLVSDIAPDNDSIVRWDQAQLHWDNPSDEQIKQLEDAIYDVVKLHPWGTQWAFSTETETRNPMINKGNFDGWARMQLAAWRGIKRANPSARVLPDGGTSGFGRLRGYREMEGYLKATQGKVKWDAIAVHPYGMLDGINGWDDADVNIPLLQDLMKKYGYGPETPIDFTEGFNVTDTNIPEWGDDGCYDNFQADKPTYDLGWKEYLQAAWVAREYIMCLKYWPQVRSFNIWTVMPYLDLYFAPLSVCKVPNTLGHLFPNPKYKATVRPAAGVRGYVFEDEQGRGVAALWCALDKVEEGLEAGPDLAVNFGDKVPEFIDLMGNTRHIAADHGTISIPLNPAPVFLRSENGGAEALADALNKGSVSGAASSLRIAIQPTLSGNFQASLTNLTSHALHGSLLVGNEQVAFEAPANAGVVKSLVEKVEVIPGKMYEWSTSLGAKFDGGRTEQSNWNMSFFYVPHTDTPMPLDPSAPEWKKIPSISLTNWHLTKAQDGSPLSPTGAKDLQASYQLTWDADHLYLRVSAVDDDFVLPDASKFHFDPSRDSQFYNYDGALEVYFDTGANGRTYQMKGFNPEDYRYDFFAGNPEASSGPGLVYRFAEPYHQLAGGLEMPTKTDASQNVKCQYEREGNAYSYVVIFPKKYTEPLKLEPGWQAGFGLFLHDKDGLNGDPGKGLSLATEPGAACDMRPDLWPIMILMK